MKAREFWISENRIESCDCISEGSAKPNIADCFGPIHVIEYAAYAQALKETRLFIGQKTLLGIELESERAKVDEWKEQCEKLAEALEKYRHIGSNDIQEVGKEPITANEALASYEAFKKEIGE